MVQPWYSHHPSTRWYLCVVHVVCMCSVALALVQCVDWQKVVSVERRIGELQVHEGGFQQVLQQVFGCETFHGIR